MVKQLFFLLFFCHLLGSVEILFCAHSKAEAIDIGPLITKCIDEGHDVHILAFGTAKTHLGQSLNLLKLPEELEFVGTKGPLTDESAYIEDIIEHIPPSDLFVCGLASFLQIELMNRLDERSIIGVVDGFYNYETHPTIHKLDTTKLTALFVPWSGMIPFWKQHVSTPLFAVGKVDLEEKIDHRPDPNKMSILYSGGYGPRYEKDFNLFVKSMQFWQNSTNKPHEILISLHPANHVDGSIEKKVLEKSKLQFVQILDKSIPTSEVMEKAHVLITAYSTTTIKASLNGLPSMHVSFGFKNSLTHANKIPCVRSRRQFFDTFNHLTQSKKGIDLKLTADSTTAMYHVLQTFFESDYPSSAE